MLLQTSRRQGRRHRLRERTPGLRFSQHQLLALQRNWRRRSHDLCHRDLDLSEWDPIRWQEGPPEGWRSSTHAKEQSVSDNPVHDISKEHLPLPYQVRASRFPGYRQSGHCQENYPIY
jgi:hypothetical protein